MLIFALQRTGGTNFTSALGERLQSPTPICHEPFLQSRVFGDVTRRWKRHRNRKHLERDLHQVLSTSVNIKHCYEVVPTEINDTLLSVAEKEGYRVLFLYRKNSAARMLSAEFARRSNVWGSNDAVDEARLQDTFSDPLDVEKLLKVEAANISLANALWRDARARDVSAVAISFEEIYESDPAIAKSSIEHVFDELGLAEKSIGVEELVERLRNKGNQGTRDKYAQFERYDELVERARSLPTFEISN